MSEFIKWEKQFKKAGSCLTYGLDSFWVPATGRRYKWAGTEEITKFLEKEGVCQLCHLEGKMGKDHMGSLLFCFPVGEGHLHRLPCSPAGSFSLLYPAHGACPMDFWWKVTCPFRGGGTGRPLRSLRTQTSQWLYDHDCQQAHGNEKSNLYMQVSLPSWESETLVIWLSPHRDLIVFKISLHPSPALILKKGTCSLPSAN